VWTGEDDLSRLLGGKASTDTDDWTPDMNAVRAVVHSTLAEKRYKRDASPRPNDEVDHQQRRPENLYPTNHKLRSTPCTLVRTAGPH